MVSAHYISEMLTEWKDSCWGMQHRGERRGLGGIFFDDLNDRDGEKLLAFSTGTIFLQSQF